MGLQLLGEADERSNLDGAVADVFRRRGVRVAELVVLGCDP